MACPLTSAVAPGAALPPPSLESPAPPPGGGAYTAAGRSPQEPARPIAEDHHSMKYNDLRDFIAQLEQRGELKRIGIEVDPYLEVTEICDRTLRAGGPALLFERPKGSQIPLLANLFGTPKRVALGMGEESVEALREVGRLLAFLKEPDPPKGMREAWAALPIFRKVLDMAPKVRRGAPCQEVVYEGQDVDLGRLPIQHCWPGDVGPLITWGLVVTRGPDKPRQNLGIYRMQVLGPNRVIMRWLAHRGGALDFRDWQRAHPGEPFPVAVALGADPATILAAVTPVPDSLSEYAFAGLLRGSRTEVTACLGSDLQVPASAEIVLEGHIHPGDTGPGGPLRRPHRLLQRGGQLPRLHHRAPHPAPRPHLPQHLHGAPPGRAGHPRGGPERGLRPHPVQAIPRDRRFLPAAGGVLLPARGGQHAQAVPGACQAGHARGLVLPATVHVHQVRHRGGRGREHPRLEGRDLGHDHPHGPGARHGPDREHPHRLPGLRLTRVGPGLQDRLRRHQQVAGGDAAGVGPPHPDGRGGQAAGG